MELKKNNKFKINNLKYNLGNYIVPLDTKNGVAVDIGSNNGCFIHSFKEHFSKIDAYEANFFLSEKLNEIFNEFDHIKIHNKAVSSHDNNILKLLAHIYSEDNGSSCIEKEIQDNHWNEFICEVTSISIESILKNNDNYIDYMKIDCETSEYEFLMNKDLQNIKYIAIEMHSQLGIKKYTDLYNFICKTHLPSQDVNYINDAHQEILFVKN